MQQPTALLNQAQGLLIQAVRQEPVKLSISVFKRSCYHPKHFCYLGYVSAQLAAD